MRSRSILASLFPVLSTWLSSCSSHTLPRQIRSQSATNGVSVTLARNGSIFRRGRDLLRNGLTRRCERRRGDSNRLEGVATPVWTLFTNMLMVELTTTIS